MSDPVNALEQLAVMRERQLVTEAEYQAKRAEILGRIAGPAQQASSSFHQDLARTTISVQNFNLKVIVGRLIGVIIALAIWYLAVLPMVQENVIAILVLFFVAAFGGMWIGERVTLEAMKG